MTGWVMVAVVCLMLWTNLMLTVVLVMQERDERRRVKNLLRRAKGVGNTRPNLTLFMLIVDAHNNYLYYGGKHGKQYAAWEEQLSADMASFENPDVDETIREIHKYIVFGIDE